MAEPDIHVARRVQDALVERLTQVSRMHLVSLAVHQPGAPCSWCSDCWCRVPADVERCDLCTSRRRTR